MTQSNLAGLRALLTDLASKLTPGNWQPYFALIDDNNIGWSDVLTPGQNIGEALAELARLASKLGFAPALPGVGDCGFCSVPFGGGGIVVNADGKLYSCWDTAGFTQMSVGDVWSGYIPAEPNGHKWVSCGYRSLNQGDQPSRSGQLQELDWTLRELAVSS